MPNRYRIERCKKEREILLRQYEETRQAYLVENNPSTKVLLKQQLEKLEAQLQELDECINGNGNGENGNGSDKHKTLKLILKKSQAREIHYTLVEDNTNIQKTIFFNWDDWKHIHQHVTAQNQFAVECGKRLYATIFDDQIKNILQTASQTCAQNSAMLRLLIQSDDPDCLNLPWDWLHDGQNFWVMQHNHVIVRLMHNPNIVVPAMLKSPQNILITDAIPQGYKQFGLVDNNLFQIHDYQHQFDHQINVPRLINVLQNKNHDVWHHHGYVNIERGEWILCDAQRRPTTISFEQINSILNESVITRVVWVMESDSKSQNQSIPFTKLMTSKVMTYVILPADMTTIAKTTFLNNFYKYWKLLPIESAFRSAQMITRSVACNQVEWSMPLLVTLSATS